MQRHYNNMEDNTITTKIQGLVEIARLMRGHVPEWGDDYIERFIPSKILYQLYSSLTWIDAEGFWWGFGYVCARKNKTTQENVIILATKYHGLGTFEHKILVIPNQNVLKVWADILS